MREIARQLAPIRHALFALLSDRPSGGTDVLAFELGRKPLDGSRDEARQFLYTSVPVQTDTPADIWLNVRALLRAEPNTPLSDFAVSIDPA